MAPRTQVKTQAERHTTRKRDRYSDRSKTNICSIFGQIEGIIAHAMAAEGKVVLISPEDIPPEVLWNDVGERASCALIFTPKTEREFDRRVAQLRT